MDWDASARFQLKNQQENRTKKVLTIMSRHGNEIHGEKDQGQNSLQSLIIYKISIYMNPTGNGFSPVGKLFQII